MTWSRRCLLAAGPALLALRVRAEEPPLEPGAKPHDLGRPGAGEGPAWKAGDGLYFTGGNKISRRDAVGAVNIYREPAGGANGLLFDSAGRLIVCEARNRRVTRTEPDGTITVLADAYAGMRFNSPNDLTIDFAGRIYFSDPRYGSRDGMEIRDEQGRTVEGVYRIDAPGKVARVLGREVERPNGVLVSVSGKSLYVADNNNNQVGGARKLWRFALRKDGSVDPATRALVFDWRNGRGPDGVKTDRLGRLYVAGGRNQANEYESADRFKGGVYILSPLGKLLEFVTIPVDEVTNCAFGDDDLRTLYITAGGTLWSIRVKTPGHVPHRAGNRAG